ncbi:MAG: NAD(P)-dependent alcohol dehydrogenase [Chlamydiales bacterium]|nr:NAD(P)-dependent alcohol dehydrogenase [Chlamydiales bacterium]
MKCYLVDGRGIDSVTLTERPSPVLKNDQDVLVQVNACSLNYRDLMVAKGLYQYKPSTFPPIVALSDMSGVVLAVGDGVSDLKPGDRVLNSPFKHWPAGTLRSGWARTFVGALGLDGVLAEQIVYPADSLVKIPDHLEFAEASTFTVAGLTAWSALVTHGKTQPGEWVLLQGTGGVSTFAAQLAHAMGARTIMTTSSPEKAAAVKRDFGVTATVNYNDADWPQQVKDITQGSGVDVIVDVVGGDSLSQCLSICNYGARVAVIGVLAGTSSNIQIRDLLVHQVQIRGIYMESTEELRALIRAVDTLKLKPVVDKIFPFSHAADAYKHLESQKHIGKVVISI